MKINLIGEVNNEMCEKLYAALDVVEAESKVKNRVLEIDLTSEGGDPMLALAMASRIADTEAVVSITARGLVASSAVIIYAEGHRRLVTSSAQFLVHESSVHEWAGTVSEMELEVKEMRKLESIFNKRLQERTLLSETAWAEKNTKDTFISAEEAIRIGLADEYT